MSRLRHVTGEAGVFEGMVSLRNQGGFASVRAALENTDLSEYAGLRLRVRGDGRIYRVTLRNDRRLSGLNYQAEFATADGDWVEAFLPFDGFEVRRRGSTARDAEPLDPSRIRQVGFMIADGHPGPFRLEVAWIRGSNL